jgi:hypothetical protein
MHTYRGSQRLPALRCVLPETIIIRFYDRKGTSMGKTALIPYLRIARATPWTKKPENDPLRKSSYDIERAYWRGR